MSKGFDLLEELSKRRETAKATRQEWWESVRKNHELPTHLELTIVHETGVMYEKDDEDKTPLAQATEEELEALAAIPSDENYARWESDLLRQIAQSAEAET